MNYLWLDLETTGLDPDVHAIIECAAVVTDEQLVEKDRFETFVRYDEHKWSLAAARMHIESGLLKELGEGRDYWQLPHDMSLNIALVDLVLKNHPNDGSKTVLAGNSVHFDRGFIKRHLPNVDGYLSHRHFDVSVLRELAPIWWPDLKLPEQEKPHRAMPDVEQALELARFFKEKLNFVREARDGWD